MAVHTSTCVYIRSLDLCVCVCARVRVCVCVCACVHMCVPKTRKSWGHQASGRDRVEEEVCDRRRGRGHRKSAEERKTAPRYIIGGGGGETLRVKSDEDLWRRRAGPVSFGLRGSARFGGGGSHRGPVAALARVSIRTVLYERM